MSDIDDDFEKVAHSGGKVTFKIQDGESGRTCSISLTHEVANRRFVISGIYALLPHGIPVGTIQNLGIGARNSPPAPGCIPVFIVSDQEGFFGRTCPACKKYFRLRSGAPVILCPYCGVRSATQDFLTEAQKKYIGGYVQTFCDAFESGKDATIDMDQLGREAAVNARPLYYEEEKQQTRIDCVACGAASDVMGLYGFCPECGHRNALAVVNQILDALEDRVSNPRYSAENQRSLRDMEWRNIIRDCVASFEGFGRDLLQCLAKLPATPARRKAAGEINFHNPIKVAESLKALFDIDLLIGIDSKDREFIRKRFHRRSIYEHKSGQVDEEYVAKSGDTGVKIGQIIREGSSNAATLIRLVRIMAKNFDDGFHSIN